MKKYSANGKSGMIGVGRWQRCSSLYAQNLDFGIKLRIRRDETIWGFWMMEKDTGNP
jgi:hypothetical protein